MNCDYWENRPRALQKVYELKTSAKYYFFYSARFALYDTYFLFFSSAIDHDWKLWANSIVLICGFNYDTCYVYDKGINY